LISTLRQQYAEQFYRFIKFGITGCSNTLLSYSIFAIMNKLTGSLLLAQCLGYGAGILWSFFLNSRWTFKEKEKNSSQKYRFIVFQLCLMVSSAIVIKVMVESLGIGANLAWLSVMCIITLINFLGCDRWVFRGSANS